MKDSEYPSWNIWLQFCPCTHTCQQEFCQQIQWCMDEAAWTHLRDLQLIHIKQQERGVKSHRSFNSSSIFNLTVEKYWLSNCWTVSWICSKLRPNMVFSSLMCFWGKYYISQNCIAFFFMNLLHWNMFQGLAHTDMHNLNQRWKLASSTVLITKLYSRLSYCGETGKIFKIWSILKRKKTLQTNIYFKQKWYLSKFTVS